MPELTEQTGARTSAERFVYKYFQSDNGRREWCVTGPLGSVSFWCSETPPGMRLGFEKYYGGVETHYRKESKPEYLGEGSYHQECASNGGECWHDGTSLWASEYWIPCILPCGQEAIWQRLKLRYFDQFHNSQTREESPV